MPATALHGWGRAVTSAAEVIPAPRDPAPWVIDHPRGVLARGMARSYGDAAQNAGGIVIDMTARGRIHALDAQTGRVRLDAGVTLDELLRAIVPHGWFLPVTPGTRLVSVGGALAADVHGKNHVAAGSVRRHVVGFTLYFADDTQRWITPADTDVFAATLGGMGLTGVILDAELQLRPITTTWFRTVTQITSDLDATFAALEGSRAPYRVATLDLLTPGAHLGRGIVDTGDHAAPADLTSRAACQPLRYAPAQRGDIPDLVPSGLLGRTAARAFNAAWFARAPKRPRERVIDLDSYLYPLDALGHWNRLYGPRGFVQYQFAVPLGCEETLRRIVERFATARCPTFIVVLKRLGPGAGMLSFPLEGWTLAADIPAGVAGLSGLLDACDDLLCEAGGRVYLTKDARLRPERMAAMYPEATRWRQVRDRLDPTGRWRSDLGRRLGLCGS